MIKSIPKSDVVVRPFKVYKEWTLDDTDVTPIYGERITGSLFNPDTDPISNGFYKRVVFDSIKTQYYNTPSTASILSEIGLRKNYTSTDERDLLDEPNINSIWVLSIPHEYYGEGVKIGSMNLLDKTNNRTYVDDGNSNLVSTLDDEIYGNIFYDRGLIVMHSVDESLNELTQFSISYRSTMTIYENEIFISVLENEFNVSQNPSAVYEVGGETKELPISNRYKKLSTNDIDTIKVYNPGFRYVRNSNYPFVSSLDGVTEASFDDYQISGSVDETGSYLTPFITTIGLYDDELNMVAVAKLPQPIKSLPDYPVNFIIRFDT